MKIFITGGTGFIGQHVVQKLKSSNHKLLILSRKTPMQKEKNIDYIKGNLANIKAWAQILAHFHPEAAIHIAWEGLPDHSVATSQKNLFYSLNLTEVLAQSGCKRLVSTGSCWEYGNKTGKLTESNEVRPFDPFTAAKHSFRLLGSEIAKEQGMEFIWTRLFYVYGPNQHPQSLIPHLINSLSKSIKPEIRNPLAKNDFIYVGDVAKAISTLATQKTKQATDNNIFNIGSGKLTTVSKLTNHIFKTFHKKKDIKKIPSSSKDQFTSAYADISKIKEYYHWKPETSINQGILKTINDSKLHNQTLRAR